MKNKSDLTIGVFGLWHLGSVYATGFAEMGFSVTAFDTDASTINDFKKNIPPIHEPSLADLVKKHNNKKLNFTNSPDEAAKNKKYLFVTQDVPINNKDQVQLDSFWDLIKIITKNISPKTIVVVSSQVPVTTCRRIEEILSDLGKDCPVVCMPENLRLGSALDNFLKPDRIVLGSDSDKAMKEFADDFKDFNCEILTMSPESAEMSKHAMNAYLALNISFSSEISDICEQVGADMRDIVRALKTDRRVSPKAPINPGMGFAGGTLGRDLESLKAITKANGYKPRLIESISSVNKDRITRLVEKITKNVAKLKGSKIGILGLTYKPNTNTLRRSQSLVLAKKLNSLGVRVKALDFCIVQEALPRDVLLDNNPDTFFSDIDAVVLMTEWPVFLEIVTKRRLDLMKSKIVIDAKNFLDGPSIKRMGGNYLSVGYRL